MTGGNHKVDIVFYFYMLLIIYNIIYNERCSVFLFIYF